MTSDDKEAHSTVAEQSRRTRKLPDRDLRRDRGRVGERVDQHNATRHDRPSSPEPQAARPVRTEGTRVQRPVRHEQRDRRRGGTPWWIWLLGLLALGVVAFMIFQSADADLSGVEAGTGNEVGTVDGTGADGAAAATGTVSSSDGVDLLDLGADPGSLAPYEETSVEGASAPVESVVGDETFWVGGSPARRLFVFLNLLGESGPDIDAGDDVTFNGTVKALPVDFEQRFDVSGEEGADQLEEQGRYIEVIEITKG
jgi:hypothetical protein